MPPINIDSEEIRKLAELLKDTGLSEIEILDGTTSIRVAREIQVHAVAPVSAAAVAAPIANNPEPAAIAGTDIDTNPGTVKSPMVGTAYLKPDPEADVFVKTGQSVNEGDTLMIIEAMKVMNPIKAHKSGTVSKILIQDAQPVEFDEALMLIE